MRNIAKTLERLGACSSKIAEYEKYGDDLAGALRHAKAADVNWFLDHVAVPLKLLVSMPTACKRDGCSEAHPGQYSLKKKKEIVAELWRARSLKKAPW